MPEALEAESTFGCLLLSFFIIYIVQEPFLQAEGLLWAFSHIQAFSLFVLLGHGGGDSPTENQAADS